MEEESPAAEEKNKKEKAREEITAKKEVKKRGNKRGLGLGLGLGFGERGDEGFGSVSKGRRAVLEFGGSSSSG